MRDCSNNRGGFDRVLMAVAATFLTVSATSAMAQGPSRASPGGTRNRRRGPASRTRQRSAADRQPISRWTPRRPRAGSRGEAFRCKARRCEADRCRGSRACGSRHDGARNGDHGAKRAAAEHAAHRVDRQRRARAAATAARCGSRRARDRCSPAADRRSRSATCRRRISRSPTSSRTCSPPRRCAISTARPSAPRSRSSTARATTRRCGRRRGSLTDNARGVIARLKDAASDGLNASRLSGAGFRCSHHAGRARRSRSEADRQHARLCAPGPERPHALVAGFGRHPVSGTSDRSGRSARQCHAAQRMPPPRSTATTRRKSFIRS